MSLFLCHESKEYICFQDIDVLVGFILSIETIKARLLLLPLW